MRSVSPGDGRSRRRRPRNLWELLRYLVGDTYPQLWMLVYLLLVALIVWGLVALVTALGPLGVLPGLFALLNELIGWWRGGGRPGPRRRGRGR